jgi:hypothetical protein
VTIVNKGMVGDGNIHYVFSLAKSGKWKLDLSKQLLNWFAFAGYRKERWENGELISLALDH